MDFQRISTNCLAISTSGTKGCKKYAILPLPPLKGGGAKWQSLASPWSLSTNSKTKKLKLFAAVDLHLRDPEHPKMQTSETAFPVPTSDLDHSFAKALATPSTWDVPGITRSTCQVPKASHVHCLPSHIPASSRKMSFLSSRDPEWYKQVETWPQNPIESSLVPLVSKTCWQKSMINLPLILDLDCTFFSSSFSDKPRMRTCLNISFQLALIFSGKHRPTCINFLSLGVIVGIMTTNTCEPWPCISVERGRSGLAREARERGSKGEKREWDQTRNPRIAIQNRAWPALPQTQLKLPSHCCRTPIQFVLNIYIYIPGAIPMESEYFEYHRSCPLK